jgi:phosphoribosylformimino-5-aminoimidazole carboxamide ribotide isomerase
MRILGVIDLMHGRAVHARGGRRDRYAPIQEVGDFAIASGDAVELARLYVERFGIGELYAADLDAIESRTPQRGLVRAVAAVAPLWLDPGVSSVDDAIHALDTGAARVIAGLETLTSFDLLAEICGAVGGNRVAFSLDLRNGAPLAGPNGDAGAEVNTIERLAAQAAGAGVGALIVLDLARVGAGTGPDLAMIARVRDEIPSVGLFVGGGIRGPEDLAQLAAAGCDGALIASAIHDGRLLPEDVAAARFL